MSIKRAGMVASLILMLFLLTGGYYVQVYISVSTHSICMLASSDALLLAYF
jgi:hypothetical protein